MKNLSTILWFIIIGLIGLLFLPKEKVEVMAIGNLERSVPILFADGYKTQVVWAGFYSKNKTDSNLIETMQVLTDFTTSQITRINEGQRVHYDSTIHFFERTYGELKKIEFWIADLPVLEPIFDHSNTPITSLEKAIFKNWLVRCYAICSRYMIRNMSRNTIIVDDQLLLLFPPFPYQDKTIEGTLIWSTHIKEAKLEVIEITLPDTATVLPLSTTIVQSRWDNFEYVLDTMLIRDTIKLNTF